MQEIKCHFREAIERAHNVKSFRFTLEKEFGFKPGQFVQVIFDEENRGNKELNKILSLSCCPGMGYIEVTKKISESNFSKRLGGLQNGDDALFNGPMGNLTISGLGKKSCFLVGGIGITPVFPMIEYIVKEGLKKDVVLLYSNWAEEGIAFKGELDKLVKENEKIKIVNIIASGNDGKYVKGFIIKEVIMQFVDDYQERGFYIFGPPKMVEAMKEICKGLGLEKEKIKFESFMGY